LDTKSQKAILFLQLISLARCAEAMAIERKVQEPVLLLCIGNML
jgi:hypothetical protein